MDFNAVSLGKRACNGAVLKSCGGRDTRGSRARQEAWTKNTKNYFENSPDGPFSGGYRSLCLRGVAAYLSQIAVAIPFLSAGGAQDAQGSRGPKGRDHCSRNARPNWSVRGLRR